MRNAMLRRWALAAGLGMFGSSALGQLPPAEPLAIQPAGGINPPTALPTTTLPPGMPAPVPAPAPTTSSVMTGLLVGSSTTGDCGTGDCTSSGSRKDARKAERKQILAAVKDCKNMPARQVPPIGTFTRQAFDTQRDNALAEYFVMYDIEWLRGTAELNGYGKRHMEGMSRRLGGNSHPIKIEASGNAALDEARKAAILLLATQCGLDPAGAASRVVIGCGRAEGLRYDEIEAVYERGRFGGGNQFGGNQFGGFGGGFGR